MLGCSAHIGPTEGPPHFPRHRIAPLTATARQVRSGRAEEFFLVPVHFTDKTLECADCGQQFNHSAQDQQFYAERQFSEPRRCPTCRAVRKAARGDSPGGSYSSGGSGGYSDRAATASGRCSPPPATAAVARHACRSGRPAPSRSIAATASAPDARPMRPFGRPSASEPVERSTGSSAVRVR